MMLTLLTDGMQVYKQFVENESFRRFVTDMVYRLTQGHGEPRPSERAPVA